MELYKLPKYCWKCGNRLSRINHWCGKCGQYQDIFARDIDAEQK